MNEVKVFESGEFGRIRTLEIGGEPWFVGKDVAEALGYGKGKSLNNAVANHVDAEDKGVTEMVTPGGKQEMTIINESGVYALIFGSRLPSAKRFKRWVTSEVLPAIRKTGAYSVSVKEARQRELTKDDYIRAASIIAGCRNERLPYVMSFLEEAGFERMELGAQSPAPPGGLPMQEDGFGELAEELMETAWEHNGRLLVTCREFSAFCSRRGVPKRLFRRWLHRNGHITATRCRNGGKLEYCTHVWLGGETVRCIEFTE